jgi:hypothetical protein
MFIVECLLNQVHTTRETLKKVAWTLDKLRLGVPVTLAPVVIEWVLVDGFPLSAPVDAWNGNVLLSQLSRPVMICWPRAF